MHAHKHKHITLKLDRTQERRKSTKDEKVLTIKESGKTIVCTETVYGNERLSWQYQSHIFCLTQNDKIEYAKT